MAGASNERRQVKLDLSFPEKQVPPLGYLQDVNAKHVLKFGKADRLKTRLHAKVAVELAAGDAVVKAGIPVKRQLHAELTRLGCAPQFATNVGIAVAVTTGSKYVVQKAEAEVTYLESLEFRRQLSLF